MGLDDALIFTRVVECHSFTQAAQSLGAACDGTTGADAGHDRVQPATRVAPDLLRGRAAVDLGVGRVLELLKHDRARMLGQDAVSLIQARLVHARAARGSGR